MTLFLSILIGAAIGAGAALAIYALGFVVEFLNCTWQFISCNTTTWNDAIPILWSKNSFFTVLIFCVICGAVVGLVVGICKTVKEQKVRYAQLSYETNERFKANQTEAVKQIRETITISDNMGNRMTSYINSAQCNEKEQQDEIDAILDLTKKCEQQQKQIIDLIDQYKV